MDIIFSVDNQLKQEFLTNYASSVAFVLKVVDEYEKKLNKTVYEMEYPEIRKLITSQFKNSSQRAVFKNVNIIKKYVSFCVEKGVASQNFLETITARDMKIYFDKEILRNKIITREKLMQYQLILYNEQDQLLLELPFVGVRGRTIKTGTLEEIINLKMSDVDVNKRMLTLTPNKGEHRRLEVDLHTIELIKQTYNQEIYLENNGELKSGGKNLNPREIPINKVEDYVLRVPGKKKFTKVNPTFLSSTMERIQQYVENPYLTFTSLYDSGMVNMAMDIYKVKGIVTRDDYIDICDRYNYGSGDPTRYWYNIKNLFEQYKELEEEI